MDGSSYLGGNLRVIQPQGNEYLSKHTRDTEAERNIWPFCIYVFYFIFYGHVILFY